MALTLVEHRVDGPADLLAEQLVLDLGEPRLGIDLLDQVPSSVSSPTGDCRDSGSRRPISVRSSISSTVAS